MSSLRLEGENSLLYVAFNQDYGCFSVGTDSGFRIYNCEPFKETFRRDFTSGGIGIVEMLFRCNILALVGGGRNPRYPPQKVMIWDDHQNRCIGELSFRSEVQAVRLRRDRVVAALSNKVYVYNFADLSLLDHIDTADNPRGESLKCVSLLLPHSDTADNPRGLCVLCPSPTSNVLAIPGAQRGHVRVELYDLRKTTLIAAHEAALACIALNASGTRLATASEKGTLIRVYDTLSGELLQEVRRGADKAEVYSIAFNANASMLACTSDKGTVHIFKLREGVHDGAGGSTGSSAPSSSSHSHSHGHERSSGNVSRRHSGAETTSTAPAGDADGVLMSGGDVNAKSTFSFMKAVLPKYFSSEWSFAQFRVPDTRSVCAFGTEPNTIMVVGADGSFFVANFEKGGEATRVAYSQFVTAAAQ